MRVRVLTAFLAIFLFLGGAVLYPTYAATIVSESEDTLVEYTEDLEDNLYITGAQNVSVTGNINGDLFAAGGRVEIEGNVADDLYISGGMVVVDGNVGGNVIAASGQIEINGNVSGSIYTAGGTLDLNGDIGRDAMIAGGQINIRGNVGDDLRAAGGMIVVDGNVSNDLMAASGQLDIKGTVGGDAYISGDSINIRSEKIGGDLVFFGNEDRLDIDDSTVIGGEYRVEEPKIDTDKDLNIPGTGILDLSGFALFFKLVFTFTQALGFILLGWLVYKFAPVKIENTLTKMHGLEESAKSLGVGFIAFPAGMFVVLFLALIVVGWPTITVIFALFSLATTLVVPIMGIKIGRWILGQFNAKNPMILPLIIGVMLIQFFRLIPILGWMFYAVLFLIAIGSMIRMQYEKFQEARKNKTS